MLLLSLRLFNLLALELGRDKRYGTMHIGGTLIDIYTRVKQIK